MEDVIRNTRKLYSCKGWNCLDMYVQSHDKVTNELELAAGRWGKGRSALKRLRKIELKEVALKNGKN